MDIFNNLNNLYKQEDWINKLIQSLARAEEFVANFAKFSETLACTLNTFFQSDYYSTIAETAVKLINNSQPIEENIKKQLANYVEFVMALDTEAITKNLEAILTKYVELYSAIMPDEENNSDDSEYVNAEITETLSTAFDLTHKLIPPNAVETEAFTTSLPKKLTLEDVYNLVMLLLTVLSIYMGMKSDPQMEELITLQEQEIEILQENNETYESTIAELNKTLTLLSDQLELYVEYQDEENCSSYEFDTDNLADS